MKLSELRPANVAPKPAVERKPKPWADMVPAYLGDETDDRAFRLPTREELAVEFASHIGKVIEHRKAAADLISELTFLDDQLDNPALADHPKREWGLKRYDRLALEQTHALNRMLIQTYYAERLWMVFSIDERVEHGLDRICGVGAETVDRLGYALPFIREGPLQEQAPIPEEWRFPRVFLDQVDGELAEMANLCPF